MLYQTDIATPLGPMLAVGDERAVYLLEFKTRPDLDKQLVRLGTPVRAGEAKIFAQLRKELAAYFAGTQAQFRTPVKTSGTPYQKRAWEFLCHIPAGETRSYEDETRQIGGIARSVGQANRRNRLAILVPCHRVRRKDGTLGGYAGGVDIKEKLLAHERRYFA